MINTNRQHIVTLLRRYTITLKHDIKMGGRQFHADRGM